MKAQPPNPPGDPVGDELTAPARRRRKAHRGWLEQAAKALAACDVVVATKGLSFARVDEFLERGNEPFPGDTNDAAAATEHKKKED